MNREKDNGFQPVVPRGDTRFKKGQSGNPRGRPKKTAKKIDPGKSLQAVDNELISVKVDGKLVRMPKVEIHIRQLFTRTMKGELAAAEVICSMAAKYFAPDAQGPQQTIFKPPRGCSDPRSIN
ncbi:DUF5681 domain-containing protein [Bradyrhizobium sp. LLZ17]|uniref:DUF5681 domain-containing protein n=1 Tax=Bradyrhizobium sp. LLZ17 TaxID=3239388 RepID=A0AB39XT36_9BRAD